MQNIPHVGRALLTVQVVSTGADDGAGEMEFLIMYSFSL